MDSQRFEVPKSNIRFGCTETMVRSGGRWLALFVVALALSACGNGGNSDSDGGDGNVPPSSEILAAARIIDWSLAGAKTNFAARTTPCGLMLSPSGGGDSTAIMTAIELCPPGQVVQLSAGTFKIDAPIVWGDHSNVTLRGSGPGVTTLQGQGGIIGESLFDFTTGRSPLPDYDWVGNPAQFFSTGTTKDFTRVVTTGAHGWTVGTYVLIDQEDTGLAADPPVSANFNFLSRLSGNRLQGQIVKITNVTDAMTADFTPPLYFTYTPGATLQSAIGIKANTVLNGISLESFSVDNHVSGVPYPLDIAHVFDSQFYDLDLDGIPVGSQSAGMRVFNSAFLSIRHCKIHGAEGYLTNQGYGIWLKYTTSSNLIEDNIFYRLVLSVVFEGSSTGNVIAYNYSTENQWEPCQLNDCPNRIGFINHGGAMMNLLEGNQVSGRWREDIEFGTGHYNILVRNRFTQDTEVYSSAGVISTILQQLQTIDIEKGHWYTAFIGNVLGIVGRELYYEANGVGGLLSNSNTPVLYRLGYIGAFNDEVGSDPMVASTMIRHGNWDSVNQAVVWDPSNSNRVIPNSFYLKSKPAFFGGCAWPWNGPDLTPLTQTLPAKARYDGTPSC